jgi:pullulanase
VGKAAFVKFNKTETTFNLDEKLSSRPIVYEASVRDLTSLRKDVKNPGTFSALKEIKLAEHLKKMNFTHLQLLPVHNCFTLNENNENILHEGDGKG